MSKFYYKTGYSLKDVSIIPSMTSRVESRKEVDVLIDVCGKKRFPVIVAPMSSVVDLQSYKAFNDAGYACVIPRSVSTVEGLSLKERLKYAEDNFVSVSLDEAESIANEEIEIDVSKKTHICIDIAQGAMIRLINICVSLKDKYKSSIVIMSGNIANPETYSVYCQSGIDYVRVSIGTGKRCATTDITGIGMPMATLLDEINDIKSRRIDNGLRYTKVIADGGIDDIKDINKALVLGADLVMSGYLFAKTEEACGDIMYANSENDVYKGVYWTYKEGDSYGSVHSTNDKHFLSFFKKHFRNYYGMSTEKAQKEFGKTKIKPSEGIEKIVSVDYTLKTLTNKIEASLRSCMSYLDALTIPEMSENGQVIIMGGSSLEALKK